MRSLLLLFSSALAVGASTGGQLRAQGSDTLPAFSLDTSAAAAQVRPLNAAGTEPLRPAEDTTRPRRRAIEVSDAYALRLRIHHYTSYAMLPLFALQSISGNQLYQSGGDDPGWAKSLHGVSAFGIGTVFTVNTVTGLWNLWDSRSNPDGRVKRWLHSGLLLASDAGFAYAGIKLGSEAKRSQSARDEHRKIAYISMGGAAVGYGIMLIGDH